MPARTNPQQKYVKSAQMPSTAAIVYHGAPSAMNTQAAAANPAMPSAATTARSTTQGPPGGTSMFAIAGASSSHAGSLLGLDSDTFYIYHVAAVMVDNLRRLLLGINLSDKAIMDFDFPGVGFPV